MKTKPDKNCPFCGREPIIAGRKTNPVIDDYKFIAFVCCYGEGYTAHAHITGYANTSEEALNNAIEK